MVILYAQYVKNPFGDPNDLIRAHGDDGVDYWISNPPDDVRWRPWVDFMANGGVIQPADGEE